MYSKEASKQTDRRIAWQKGGRRGYGVGGGGAAAAAQSSIVQSASLERAGGVGGSSIMQDSF